MLSFLLVTIAITNNNITTIDEILLRLLMLHLLMPWDIAHPIALATLLDFF
jgi:hypothetical protein